MKTTDKVPENDECRTCTLRGDIDACLKGICNHHQSWIVKELQAQIKQLADAAVGKREWL